MLNLSHANKETKINSRLCPNPGVRLGIYGLLPGKANTGRIDPDILHMKER
jgi:hypothetical protein